MKILTHTSLTLIAALLLTAAPAMAGSRSLLTVGAGSTVGLTHVLPITGGSANSMVSEVNIRLKMLRILGVDFSYNMTGEKAFGHGETYVSQMRASALLYVIPTRVMSFYLAAGAGASDFGKLTSKKAGDKTYHGGAGLEIYVGKHIALTTEFLVLVPQVDRIVVSHEAIRIDEMGSFDSGNVSRPEVSDYISIENFQMTFGMKWFF
jgi:hypothetical protein